MKLERTNNPIDRKELNNVNKNWDAIENDFNNVVTVVSEEAFERVVESATLIWQEPVDTFNDISTTYPNAEIGWAVMAREVIGGVTKAYRYNGTEWILIQEFTADAINEVDNRLTAEVDKKANEFDITERGPNLIKNSSFVTSPYIHYRSNLYVITPNIDNPARDGKKSLKIDAMDYDTSTDPNKDFAMFTNRLIGPEDKLNITFYAYPTESNKEIQLRMAYSGAGIFINLGEANQWNKIDVTLDASDMTRNSDYLYFDFRSSFILYMSELYISDNQIPTQGIPESFNQVNTAVVENYTRTQNSRGAIERLIANGQTYLDNIANLTYGNQYTAFDTAQTQVGGKYQIDCSSFANLMIHGIPYQKSKYSIADNESSRFFFQNIDGNKWRYANNIAKYAFERGYAFTPKDDLSDLRAGDIVFFSWNSGSSDVPPDQRQNSFMMIDHVGVFLHRKNDTLSTILQFDNGISTVYYEASNLYMSQCVLAARFPFDNIESVYSDENILLNGNQPKSTTSSSDIGQYNLATNLEKGMYYTMFIDGNILTPGCYFLILNKNNQTVYSDFGKVGEYSGIVRISFPYLFDTPTDALKIAIGAPSGTPTSRSGFVNWCSLYQGYVGSKTRYMPNSSSSEIMDFNLNAALVSDLNAGFAPYYKYTYHGNRLVINFNLPFNTLRTGNLALGNIPNVNLGTTQRIPCNLINGDGEAMNAILQVTDLGAVSIIPYNGSVQWRYAMANGTLFRR